MSVQMELHKIIISEMQDQQIIVLKEVDGDRKFTLSIRRFDLFSWLNTGRIHRPLSYLWVQFFLLNKLFRRGWGGLPGRTLRET